MSKRVKVTPQLEATIRNAIGDENFDASQLAVYEARFVTTEPVKKGGFFNKARVSVSTVNEMAVFMSQPGNAIPLHVMHETELLPVGKVFSAKAVPMGNGEYELRGQFYIPLSEAAHLAKIDTSVVDEVSIGLKTEHAFCSECNFDYFGPDADLMNFWELTCANDHVIGQDGVHVRLVGMENWSELSLCGTGAAQKAKILPHTRQIMSAETADRLAANQTLGGGYLIASYKLNEGDDTMDAKFMENYEKAIGERAQFSADLKVANDKIVTLDASVTGLKADLAAKDKEIEELKAKAKETDVSKIQGERDTAQAELKEATEKVLPHAKAALAASGVAEGDIPATLSATLTMIEAKGLKLHQVMGIDGKSVQTQSDADAALLKSEEDRKKASFKARK